MSVHDIDMAVVVDVVIITITVDHTHQATNAFSAELVDWLVNGLFSPISTAQDSF